MVFGLPFSSTSAARLLMLATAAVDRQCLKGVGCTLGYGEGTTDIMMRKLKVE